MEDPYTNFVQLWNPVGDRCHDNSFTFRIKWFPFRIHLLFTKLSNPGIQVYEINLSRYLVAFSLVVFVCGVETLYKEIGAKETVLLLFFEILGE